MKCKKLPYSESLFVDKLAQSMNKRDYFVQREIKTSHGHADLVLSKFNTKKAKIRFEHNQIHPILNQLYFSVLRNIPDKESTENPIPLEEILSKVCINENTLKYKILPFLEKHGYLTKNLNSYYYKINGWVPLADEHIAIEAKLYDWKNGIFQAIRYKSFAQKSYLAMPKESIHLVDHTILRKFNIGLISLDYYRGDVDFILKCIPERPLNLDMNNYVTELFWEAITENILKEFPTINFPESFQEFIHPNYLNPLNPTSI